MLDFMLYLPVDLHVDLLHLQFGMHRVEQICRFSTPMVPVRIRPYIDASHRMEN